MYFIYVPSLIKGCIYTVGNSKQYLRKGIRKND
nr:MAG TPA: hypothetical protein [Caudoviricetes sp.]